MNRSILHVGGQLIYAETLPMIPPTTGPQVRQATFFPPSFKREPTVTATVYSSDSPGGLYYGVYNITIVLGSPFVIKVSAFGSERTTGDSYQYFCSVIAIGEAD